MKSRNDPHLGKMSTVLRRTLWPIWPLVIASLQVITATRTCAQDFSQVSADQLRDYILDAHLSLAVYDLSKKNSSTGLDAGWTQIGEQSDPDGFQAAAYERQLASGQKEVRVAFAGTRDIRDIATDISQGNPVPMGEWDTIFTQEKFTKAMDFAKRYTELKDKDPNMTISFTGQSLGGTYAQICSLAFGEKATVFNSAAVVKANSMIAQSMKDEAPNLITQFVLEGDYVHDPTRLLPGAEQYGKEYRVSLPSDLKVDLLPSLFLDHGMEAFQVALESQYASKMGFAPPSISSHSDQVAAFQRADINQVCELPREGAEVVSHQLVAMAEALNDIKDFAVDNQKIATVANAPVYQRLFGSTRDNDLWIEAGKKAEELYDVHSAWEQDMKDFHGFDGITKDPTVIIRSHTLEQVAQITLEDGALPKLYDIIDRYQTTPGKFSEGGAGDFGIVDLAKGIASSAGKGYANIDDITLFCNSYIRAFGTIWGMRNFPTAGAKAWSVSGDAFVASADTIRWAVKASGAEESISQGFAGLNSQPSQLIGAWKTIQERNIYNGVAPKDIHEMFGDDLLKANGFGAADFKTADFLMAQYSQQFAQTRSESFKAVSVSQTESSFSQMAKDAQIATEIAAPEKRAVVFGDGPLADQTQRQLSQKLGSENVLRIPGSVGSYERNSIASDFGADAVVTVSEERYREVTQAGVREYIPEPPQIPFKPVQPDVPPSDFPKRPPSVDMRPFKPEYPSPMPISSDDRGGGGPPPSSAAFRDNFSHAVADSVGYGSGLGFPSPHVGGVMLQGAAEVNSGSPLTAGNFSLIFAGGDGAIDIPTLRRFVTALWATYFTTNGPGISIDPINGFTNRHVVRYIGRVVNSDLGRVMRETDYQMKSWAVGTSKPDVPNWFTPEEFGIRDGVVHVGAPSRFWFVPENMRFSKADNMLLFDSGMMTVKTEYLFAGDGEKSQENEEWAEQFTKRYNEIAQKYPIYDELFEYAKLVSLTKYLKEHRVPLLWFLLANREMVLTEDSPGTVKAFAKKSDYDEDVEIYGGVDLSAGTSADSYVVDAELLKALAEARKNSPPPDTSQSTAAPAPMEIVQQTNESLTVTPSQTVVISESRSSGDNFATDLGLRVNGNPNLEIARYRRTNFPQVHTFGRDWHLMIPYAVKPGSDARRDFAGWRVPETMILQNLLTGTEESLHFDTNRYDIAGYVPDETNDLNIGLFFLSDRTFRLADKLGCEFDFDESGRLTEMNLASNYDVSYQYAQKKINWRSFDILPFRLQPEGEDTVTLQSVTIPKKLRLFDSATGNEEVFAFNPDDPASAVRYMPVNTNSSDYESISVMTDGFFLLKHKSGTEITFDTGGRFSYMVMDILEKMIQAPYEVRFEYDVANGQYRIVAARVVDQKTGKILYAVNYEYSRDGNLAGASIASAN